MNWEYTDDKGEEHSITLPCRWEICSTCDGNGHHCQHLGAYTREQFDEQFDDEAQQRYFSGGYDKSCQACSGSGKVQVVDEDAFKASKPELFKKWEKDCLEEAAYEAMCRAERDMGC